MKSFLTLSVILLVIPSESTIFPSNPHPESGLFSSRLPELNYPKRISWRELKEPQQQTKILFRRSIRNSGTYSGPIRNGTLIPAADERCNSDKLQRIMRENMFGDYHEMKLRIMDYAEHSIGGLFSVICAPGDFSYVTTTRLYCLHAVGETNCLAFLTEYHDAES